MSFGISIVTRVSRNSWGLFPLNSPSRWTFPLALDQFAGESLGEPASQSGEGKNGPDEVYCSALTSDEIKPHAKARSRQSNAFPAKIE